MLEMLIVNTSSIFDAGKAKFFDKRKHLRPAYRVTPMCIVQITECLVLVFGAFLVEFAGRLSNGDTVRGSLKSVPASTMVCRSNFYRPILN
jgi:hypothetical protein